MGGGWEVSQLCVGGGGLVWESGWREIREWFWFHVPERLAAIQWLASWRRMSTARGARTGGTPVVWYILCCRDGNQ